MNFKGHFDRDTRASSPEAKDNAALGMGWLETLIVAIQSKVPAGYEDDDGFHFGAESNHQS